MIAWSQNGVSLRMRRVLRIYGFLIVFGWCWFASAFSVWGQGEELPPCHLRPLQVENFKPIWVENGRFCVERVIALPEGEDEELALTAIVYGDEGAIYATSPLMGEVWRFVDQDGDWLPDLETLQVILSGLHRPNALAWREGALYVVAGAEVVRWHPDGTVQTLVDDLPTGVGIWNGGIAFDEQGSAYVGSGAPCSICATYDWAIDPTPRASILRIPGSPERDSWELYATGIRQAAGLAWVAGALWATDTRNQDQPEFLYRILPGADYGWPGCSFPELPCEETVAAALTLPPNSVPLSLWYYEGSAFPGLTGSLLLALAGNPHVPLSDNGFSLAAVSLRNSETEPRLEYLVPRHPETLDRSREALALLNTGLWPQQIFGVTADERGWIYFSLSGGQIYVLRPP